MVHRGCGWVRILALIVVAVATLAISSSAYAAGSEEDVPATSIVPSGGEGASAPSRSPAAANTPSPAGAPMTTAPAARPRPATRRRSTSASHEPEVEPAQARLKLVEDTWVYSAPAKSAKHLERVTRDKFVVVTGSTHYYLQVKLKDGQTGYLDPVAVSLVSPTDKVFVLTHDAAVLDKPNRWGKKLAEVHKSRNVHVVGVSLNYMKIRMKNRLEGFIPITALE